MAKTQIKRLKERRFWRWLCVEVYGHPEPKEPIKRRPLKRMRTREWRRWERVHVPRGMKRLSAMLAEHRTKAALARTAK